MTERRLREILDALPTRRVAVLGDLFLDKLLLVDRSLDEPSLETGLTAYQVTGKRVSPGAAGTVINNLRALGVGSVDAVSMLGDDGEGYELLKGLHAIGVNTDYVIKSGEIFTPTYIKPMHIKDAVERESNRLDIVNTRPTPESIVAQLKRNLRAAAEAADAIIVLDQITRENTGVVTAALREEIALLANERPELLIFADSRGFIDKFRGITIKCNDKEAARVVYGKPLEAFDQNRLVECLHELRAMSGCEAFITCGERGILVNDRLIPAIHLTCEVDICGCGDASSAGIVSAICAGASREEAALFGNLAASVTASKIGVTGTASPEEVIAQFRAHEREINGQAG
jgi:bifunctional ADP-heptose synthase (sugar kinase/adenylyltransferase)